MPEDGELSLRQCRSALLLVLVFARDFGGLFAEFGYGKNKSRESPKIRNHRYQKGAVFLEIRTLVSSPSRR